MANCSLPQPSVLIIAHFEMKEDITLHYLVPPFILQNFTQNCLAGDFEAVCLFVDTSGFTPLTTALMAHGPEGAEAIANVLVTIFAPLVRTVYEQGGFIVGFAGDAFKAVFPTSGESNAYERAIVAAWHIRQHMVDQPYVKTRFGRFDFAVKITMADGPITWGIWQGNVRDAAQRAAYYFEGEGLARCLDADPYTKAGEIVITRALAEKVKKHFGLDPPFGLGAPFGFAARFDRMSQEVRVEAITADYWRLTDVAESFSVRYPKLLNSNEIFDEKQAAAFFSTDLLELPVQGEFRQVVTMFINLQELPEGAEGIKFQQTFFRLLAQYGGYLCRVGRIGDRDKGGTLLLFWGAPTSYENDVARALNFILDLQAETSISLRAGITWRMAYAGFVGADFREEYTCYGSYVNLAARLMVSAEWNEIWLDDEIARQADAQFEVALKGRYLFKGFMKEWPVFRLIRQCQAVEVPVYHGKMIGRTHESNQLKAAIQPIFAGHSAGLLSVLGEAGIGKSRLVYEVKSDLEHSDLCFQWHLCEPDSVRREGQSLNPFRRFLHNYFNFAPTTLGREQKQALSDKEHKQQFKQKLTSLIASTPSPVLKEELLRTRSFLGALLDLHWDDSLYVQIDHKARLANTFDALKAFIKAESLHRPFILQVEDAHWLDHDSIKLIEQLTQEIDNYPIAIIVSMRPQQVPDTFSKNILECAQSQKITLTPLSTDELSQLATQQLGVLPAEQLVELLATRADGNPFFAEQILLYLQEQEMLQFGTWCDKAGRDMPFFHEALVPPEVRAILIPQLDRLAPEIKEVVQMASVLGRQFEVKVLREMVQNDSHLAQKVDMAAQAAIWSPHHRTAPHRTINLRSQRNSRKKSRSTNYQFNHDFLQKTAYEMQLGARRRQLHQQAAEAMETVYATNLDAHYDTLAYHYEQAGVMSKTDFYQRKAGKATKHAYQSGWTYVSHSPSVTNPEYRI